MKAYPKPRAARKRVLTKSILVEEEVLEKIICRIIVVVIAC